MPIGVIMELIILIAYVIIVITIMAIWDIKDYLDDRRKKKND